MWLPRGTLVNSEKGPRSLKDINESFLVEKFNGYLRVSIIGSGEILEGVVVYDSGKPVISMGSNGKKELPDPELEFTSKITENEDAIIELCSLNQSQIQLMNDACKEFRIPVKTSQPAASQKTEISRDGMPAVKNQRQEAVKTNTQAVPGKRAGMPEIRGQFIKAESVPSLRSYLDERRIDAGHIIFFEKNGAGYKEYHIILLNGNVEAAYSEHHRGRELFDRIIDAGGDLEIYRIEEHVINSVLRMYPDILIGSGQVPENKATQQTMYNMASEGRRTIGVSAKAILENAELERKVVEDDIEIDTYDDDVALVKRVEKDFANSVDEILKKLELTHLLINGGKKKH
ncbi:hypothetical protein CUJ83_13120 [Methanocella sp. CWC-04]|uniref:Uncharacterized protein n=1 Tax=Methanooceanicella nereidis TaxID=2052831 RepID=A0AAP2RGS7_9EURY|nr:hypothetical protein [Methanocella sp. CWC-04]MCD1295937.1 hypothetical protein [Methanocella sp. CWC-04]